MWRSTILTRVLAPVILILFLCSFQTVFWPNFFGSLAPPALWLIVITWLCLYRPSRTTVLLVYLLGFFATFYTAMPLKLMLISLLLLYLFVTQTKERVFWAGPTYFALASTISILFYHLLTITLSYWLEPVPAAWMPLDRLIQVLWTPLLSYPVFVVMEWLEKLSAQTTPGSMGGEA